MGIVLGYLSAFFSQEFSKQDNSFVNNRILEGNLFRQL